MQDKRILILGIVLIGCLFVGVPSSRADIIYMEDGRTIEGEILKKNSETITIKMGNGIVTTVDRSEVDKIVCAEDLKKTFEKKKSKLEEGDEQGHLALAEWCRKNGLKDELKAELKEIIRINPDNGEAKRQLDLLDGKLPEDILEKEKKEGNGPHTYVSKSGGEKSKAAKGTPRRGVKVEVVGGRAAPGAGKGSPKKPANTKKVLAKALAYLASKQSKGGNWQTSMSHLNGQVVTTSFCALAMMAAGSTPAKGPYSVNVNRAVEFVLKMVTKKSKLDGNRNGANWNQENWRLGIGGMFLAEVYACHKDPRIKAKLQEIVQRLEANQEASGGWAHGPGGPNALNYLELEIMSNWAIATIGMAKQLGCKVDTEKLKKALDYVDQCTSGMGATAYSTRANQRGTGCPGRTGGAVTAFAMCRYHSSKLDKMAKYISRTMEQIPEGHASPALHFIGGGLGAIQVSKSLWDKYVTDIFPLMLNQAQDDGSFLHITNKEGDKDAGLGPCYTTGAFTFMLAVDQGRLSFLSGKYCKVRKSSGKKTEIAGVKKEEKTKNE
ncbi:MAG: DUF6288 domain-containing protein [Planctomycetota bacterium]|jgi:hypothetical protein